MDIDEIDMPSFWRSGVTHVVHEAVGGRRGSAQK
jgi:hypothetical protein